MINTQLLVVVHIFYCFANNSNEQKEVFRVTKENTFCVVEKDVFLEVMKNKKNPTQNNAFDSEILQWQVVSESPVQHVIMYKKCQKHLVSTLVALWHFVCYNP